jgi:poly-gamma-glutamate capsule biosynthesis protein CapA/YwtB (metallophosphatase superfamily)
MRDTIKAAKDAGIEVFGGGTTASKARKAVVIDAGGTKVAIIGAAQNWSSLRRSGWEAKGDKGGLFLMRDELLQQVTARAKKSADLVVWYPHWGDNYSPIRRSQRDLAQKLMDAGADAIVGHHSHDAQSFGWVGGKPVAWSLGNLVFGTPGRFGPDKYGEGWGLLMRMVIKDKRIVRYEFVPMQINNRINEYQPHPLTASRSREVLKKFALSEKVPLRLEDGFGILDAEPPPGWTPKKLRSRR